jgi:Flp pilus assembly protein TadG
MLYGSNGILSRARRLQRRDGERGQILVLFTLAIVVILVSASLVIDLGLLRTDKARLQTALDAGALAAGHSLPATGGATGNVAAVTAVAVSYVSKNYAGVAAPTVTYRCLIGYDSTTNLPRVSDMPAVCNVSFAANSSQWQCTTLVCWAPCDPAAIATDQCNTINLVDSADQNYTFGRVVGINSGTTGATSSAACTGLCGSPPTVPLDTVLIVDRTLSMGNNRNSAGNPPDSLATAGVRGGADEVLSIFNPAIQRVAFGVLGISSIATPSSAYTTCSGSPPVYTSAMHIGAGVGITSGNTTTANNAATATIVRNGFGATNSTTSGTGLNLQTPAGAAAGETLVAALAFTGAAPTITAAGWTQINMTSNGSNVTVVSYYRTLAAAPPATYSFTWTGAKPAVGVIVDYSGVDTTTPIDAQSNPADNTGNSKNVASNGVTGGAAGDVLVGLYGINQVATFTAPGAMNEIIDAHPTGVAPTLELADGNWSNATKTAVSTVTGQWAAHAFALNPGITGSSPFNIARPAGTANGMVLVATVSVAGAATAITPGAGWTLIARTSNGTVGVASYYRVVTAAAEPASYPFSISGSLPAVGQITQFNGVDTTSVLDPAAATANSGSGTAVQASSLSTTAPYTQEVGVFATTPATTLSTPGGMTNDTTVSFAAGGPTMELADAQIVTASATGTETANAGASGNWVAQLFGLRSLPVDTYSIDVNDPNALKAWIPVGFTGTDTDAPAWGTAGMRGNNEAYSSGSLVNTGTHLAQAIECFDGTYNGGGFGNTDGTNLATPLKMATKYLQTYGRPGVQQAIIIETDGYPQSCPSSLSATICNEYTAPAAQAAADAAKAAGILVYTIGYDGGSLSASAATLLSNMASTNKKASLCNAAENTDGDTFFCAPSSADLITVFRYVAESLSRGPHLVQMFAQPIVTGVAPATNGNPAGGTPVTITGKYFTEAYSVTFGGAPALSFTVVSDTQINATAPAGTLGTIVDIVVSTPGGSSKVVSADHFKYGP